MHTQQEMIPPSAGLRNHYNEISKLTGREKKQLLSQLTDAAIRFLFCMKNIKI